MTGKDLKEALTSGRRVYGTCITSTSPKWPEDLRRTGLDFVFIDTEHVPIDRSTLSWMCRVYGAMGMPPIVRVPSPDPVAAEMVVDGGAAGVVVPYVESVDEVRELVGAVKLRPLKGLRMRDVIYRQASLEPEVDDYLKERNADKIAIVNIESVPAMARLDDILDVPGLDAVLIGPHDLSVNLGIPEQYRDPLFDEAVREIFRKAREHGVGAGIHFWAAPDLEIAWARAGGNFIVHSTDVLMVKAALVKDLTEIREALGDKSPGITDNNDATSV